MGGRQDERASRLDKDQQKKYKDELINAEADASHYKSLAESMEKELKALKDGIGRDN